MTPKLFKPLPLKNPKITSINPKKSYKKFINKSILLHILIIINTPLIIISLTITPMPSTWTTFLTTSNKLSNKPLSPLKTSSTFQSNLLKV
jgi:hypothetical protein